MNIMCWMLGHKKNEDIDDIDFAFTRLKNAILHNKKIGTVNINYKLYYCDRCKQLFLEKSIQEHLGDFNGV